MGFFSTLKDDIALDARLRQMKLKGIYSTDDVDISCVACQHWDSYEEVCTYHGIGFNGSSNRCNKFKSH